MHGCLSLCTVCKCVRVCMCVDQRDAAPGWYSLADPEGQSMLITHDWTVNPTHGSGATRGRQGAGAGEGGGEGAV